MARDPGYAAAWYLSGIVAHQLGRHHSALECLTRAVELRPREPEYLANLGVAHYALGQMEQAIACWRETISLDADRVDARFNLALAELARGRNESAGAAFEDILARRPDHRQARSNLIRLRLHAGRPDAALPLLGEDPEPTLLIEVGNASLAAGQVEAAGSCFQRALRLNPDDPDALNGLGNTAAALEQYPAAEAHYRRALEARPEFPEALNNLGNVCSLSDRAGEATACFTRALELKPDYAEALSNLALAHDLLGEPDTALALHRRAITLEPERPDWHVNYAVNRLRAEDFSSGWKEYEWRHRTLRFQSFGRAFRNRFPWWRGEALAGDKDLLIYDEQGIGDAIFFAGFWKAVMNDARRCLVQTERRLVPLFRRAYPGAIVGCDGDADFTAQLSSDPSRTFQCAAGSVCGYTWQQGAAPARPNPYLRACPRLREQWRERLDRLGETLKIGISWRGGARLTDRSRRSIPLDQWQPVLALPGITWIDVQYTDLADERSRVSQKTEVPIHRLPDTSPMDDMDSFAALLLELDLVISVDNSTVHLAGALGQRTWVMLPHVADWRWATDRSDTRWYPELELIRQPDQRRWDVPLAEVAARLREFLR